MSEKLNQNNQQPTESQDGSSKKSEQAIDFEKLSEDEMKAVAKGLMVDFVWTLSGMNRASKEKDAKKNPQS